KRYTSSPYTCPFVGVCRRWAQSPPLVGLPYFNGRKGIDETPKCGKHEEAQQPPAESVVYTGCGRIGNLFHSYRHKSDIDRSYVAVYINYEGLRAINFKKANFKRTEMIEVALGLNRNRPICYGAI